MSLTKEIAAEIVSKIETFTETSENNWKQNVLSPNVDNVNISEDAYFELEDEWECGEFYDYIVIKGDYAYRIDAFGDNEIFGNRVLRGTDSYQEDIVSVMNNNRVTIIELD